MLRAGRPVSVAVPFVALVVAAAGCGGSSVKTDKVEQTMKAVVEGAPSSGGQISIDSVDCPSTVDKKKGAKFD
ncbi:MAG: hypothetical protein QOJ07_1481, partial [Thermoleophilaceae bacterium]|nr:hypothetical protein [Thermoleophilaceae bacterium]